ncbi:MAG: 3-phosphoshikimate 1-carboxyvinyltransferase [Clostridiales bacterium]|nr:3-phosphoshikimate 1-carboxyvinyltransferase [Clostridiales bacterium]
MSDVVINKLSGYDREIHCMPDKSMSVRAVLFNAYATGEATVKNLLLSDDVMSAVDCARRLGATVELDGNTARIIGAPFSGATLDCGNSGTTARLLIGLLSGLNGKFTLDGDASLRSRPMRRVTEPLKNMGARITDTDGHLPITVVGSALDGINYQMPIASAQVKSALMLAGLNANGTVTVTEPAKSRDHTENMLREMNAAVTVDGNTVSIEPSIIYSRSLTVPGDISSAAYPICLALSVKGGRCLINNVGINPTRTGIIDLLRSIGADIRYKNAIMSAEPVADVDVRQSALKPFLIEGELVPRLIDEIPVLCALACFIDGTSVVKDAKELKVKETDRIQSTVAALRALGADIEPTDDGMIIRGGKPLKFGTVRSELDHRIAMSAAVAGAAGAGVKIIDADCASVSYPNFFSEVIGV